uniref:Trafficking protein particle complex subunit 10 n=1 Tax=Drosophila melanogaster TaxID=7227 RepID=TPC10_DROME|nr:shal interactor of Di-Leucine motif [Drosophila melanogaster]Q9VFB7.1 RecName: Full=Trafficking protein particle complex subunit 10; AltName: Full=Shal Interactor of Di-Leucine Motif; AltName: Full=Trafficking protein particle complex subunit TMEM1; AltName: Full=Transport protein particle subunit TMEM1; Short=TRAPP subunit TMEM1 [Drosophila melanogaster]AAF55143.1 shal interactor of Di-Leucine motif [Drosophila melanogaster]AAM49960.1 LD45339p [Drosophila melanogaster]ACL90995.1 CG6623-PA [|eukprot:NP_650431.1 shal interactor of Di-Leucine motif [Drosophila melanogaster]
MQIKPIITYSGSCPLFRSLESQILNAIPLDTCEWRRTFQRPTKHVRLEAQAQQFNVAALEKYKQGDWSILEHPILHIFVTECNDVDTYKATIREAIDIWLKTLTSYGVSDWMILLVETLDMRKTKNFMPRTTVLDKIRLDFGTKNDDRCISVLNPAKFEQKSTESFRCLVQRIRFLMLTSYNRNIVKYEELIRSKREKRNIEGWDFRQYFFMQEDLALIFEKLELPTEALIQYDELDAMFSQFITHTGLNEKQQWLNHFRKPLDAFHGICLTRADKFEMRNKIRDEGVSLLEFRNYLFERQAYLLLTCNDIPEIAKRLLNFLFSTLREVELIKLECQEGALCCWEFVCALEVLQLCEQAMEPNELTCFQHCAPIWNLAKDKLYELGKLCGLLPGCTPTSEQLHIVVQLSSGIGDAPSEQHQFLQATPQLRDRSPNRKPKKSGAEQLKEALGSNQAFQKLYLELAELAISTYKHVTRLRSARLVGLDLGNFYCALNEPHKAVGFFTDLLRELKAENWHMLSSQTLLELANCYRKMGDSLAYTKTCSSISCCAELETLVRTFYFDEFLKSLKTLKTTLSAQPSIENANYCVLEDHFRILDIEVVNQKPIIQDDYILVQLKVESLYPRGVVAENVKLCYELEASSLELAMENVSLTASPSTVKAKDTSSRLKVSLQLVYKQDNRLHSAAVACDLPKSKQPVRRTSSTKRKLSPSVQADFTNFVQAENIALQPGVNLIEMKAKATRVGCWQFKQLCISMSSLEFLSEQLPFMPATFEISTKPASATLEFKTLIAGIVQPISLNVSGGSFIFPPDAKITLRCSKNLRIRQARNTDDEAAYNDDQSFESTLQVPLVQFKSFEERRIPLEVLTDMPGRKVSKHHEHHIALNCPWSRTELPIAVDFQPAMEATCRLHTCGTQKFLQVIMKGMEAHLLLQHAQVKCDVPGVQLLDLNPESQQPIEIYKSLTVTYLYEIQVEPLKTEHELPVVKVHFVIKYASLSQPDVWRTYGCAFDLVDYTTLFKLQAQLEPNELCRLRTVCNMNLKITKVHENPYTDLMYEVLNDQNLWAVCGRSAGVVSMKDVDSHSISLDVMPLSTGFLPMPSIRLSKYTAGGKSKTDGHSKVHPFPPGQVYNSTKSMQIHVIASVAGDQ